MKLDDILHYLNVNMELTTLISENNTDFKNICKKKNQRNILSEVYNLDNNNQIYDELNISLYHQACISLCYILGFIKKHQPLLLRKLKIATLIENDNKLYFGNKPLEQLDILGENKKKFI